MKNKKRRIAIFIVILIAFFAFGNRGYKTTVKQYVAASMNGNGRKVVSLMPKNYITSAISQGEYRNKREMIKDYNTILEQNIDSFDNSFGKKWKYTYKITDVYKYTKSDIEGFITISNYGYLFSKAKAMKEVSYELKVYGNGYESTTTEKLLLVKLGRKWYVADAYG